MQPLIDADILLYEIGYTCEGVNPLTGVFEIASWDHVKERVDDSIFKICRDAGGTKEPRLFLTGKNNFRISVAKKKGYKENRDKPKPFHYYNIKEYLKHAYKAEEVVGYEADDAVCIAQSLAIERGDDTIICSRDKDTRQMEGWHFSWECGKQPAWGPAKVEGFGTLTATFYPEEHKLAGQMKKLVGTGDKWFLAQLVMGDSVDNIPGLKGWGPAKTYELLREVESYHQGLDIVCRLYRDIYGAGWQEQLEEQAQLVYMVRDLDDEDNLVMWRLKNQYDNFSGSGQI